VTAAVAALIRPAALIAWSRLPSRVPPPAWRPDQRRVLGQGGRGGPGGGTAAGL